jgi:hypothetical protein
MRALIALTLLLGGCVTNIGAGGNGSPIVRQFEAVAIGREFARPGHAELVKKWTKPVRYIISHPNSSLARSARRHLSNLANVTGLDIAEVFSLDKANFRVVFGQRKQFLPWLIAVDGDNAFTLATAQSACFASTEDHGTGFVESGNAVIGTDNPPYLRDHCLLEELTQALGPLNDACHARDSIFCDGVYRTSLSSSDAIILRTLYDPRLKPGMTKAEAMPIARPVIKELMAAQGG